MEKICIAKRWTEIYVTCTVSPIICRPGYLTVHYTIIHWSCFTDTCNMHKMLFIVWQTFYELCQTEDILLLLRWTIHETLHTYALLHTKHLQSRKRGNRGVSLHTWNICNILSNPISLIKFSGTSHIYKKCHIWSIATNRFPDPDVAISVGTWHYRLTLIKISLLIRNQVGCQERKDWMRGDNFN